MADAINRIVYVDDEGDLYTVDPGGEDRRRALPEDAGQLDDPGGAAISAVNWPAWSPVGERIAFSWVSRTAGRLAVRLLVTDLESGRVTRIYENPPDVPPGIAPNLPHYISWSPDGGRLAFLTMTASGQTLFLTRSDGSGPVQPVASGAPFFPIWAPGSDRLLIHLADQLYEVEVGAAPRSLAAASRAYRVPAWSPDGRRIAFVEETPDEPRLIVEDRPSGERRPLGAVRPGVALTGSPRRAELAVSQPPAPGGAYRGIEIVDLGDGARRSIVKEDLLAYFWSPDGRQIAYVGVDLNESELYWAVVGADGRGRRRLISFLPSRDTMTALTFFDQYASSVRVWSPDSRSLVFAGRLAQPVRGNGHAGGAAHLDHIYVLDSSGEVPPRAVGLGTLGFWSWH